MAVSLGRKWTQFLSLCFTLGWAEVTPEQVLISICFSISIQQLSPWGAEVTPPPHLQIHFAKCLFLDLNIHAKVHSATTVAMAATTSASCLSSNTRKGLHQTVKYAQIQLQSKVPASSLTLVTIETSPSAQVLTAGNHADFNFT